VISEFCIDYITDALISGSKYALPIIYEGWQPEYGEYPGLGTYLCTQTFGYLFSDSLNDEGESPPIQIICTANLNLFGL
jgi:hypothetical protein